MYRKFLQYGNNSQQLNIYCVFIMDNINCILQFRVFCSGNLQAVNNNPN
jgi:hypothetical protein